MSAEWKTKGNAAFGAGRYDEAVECFTEAIKLDPSNHVFYSNRSAAHASLKRFEDALVDAQKVVELKPDWPKGYSRLGAAEQGLSNFEDAITAYKKGLSFDPDNEQMKQGVADCEKASNGAGTIDNLFNSPEIWAKIAQNPETRGFLQEPDFVQALQAIQKDQSKLSTYVSDQRIMKVMTMMLGVDLPTGASQGAKGPAASSAPPPAQPYAAPEQAKDDEAAMEEDLPDEEREAKAKKEEAKKKKEAGNAAYKAKRFEEAIDNYNAAIALDDTDITFLSNRAAVYLEMGKYDECIKDCQTAIDKGRELRADYKTIARAMTRVGTALVKKEDLEGACNWFNKSLTEHRNADTLKKLNDTERLLKERAKLAYLDPAKAAEEKQLGNDNFKNQKFPEAVAHYTEALKRLGDDGEGRHLIYSNRAACYTKLGAWMEGKRDAEKCIEIEPTFAKGYTRKAHVQFFMKEYDKAMETYQTGLQHDPSNEELKDGIKRCVEQINKGNRGELSEEEMKARQQQAMQDPEIQQILNDPVMRQVLQDMQNDPKAAAAHQKDAGVMARIQKLVNAGIIQVR